MKFAMVGAVLITLPAIIALIFGVLWTNKLLIIAATASIAINTLPFIAAGLMLRRGDGADLGH